MRKPESNSQNFISIQHISFVISNIDKSLSFYQDILGLEIDKTRPKMSFGGCWLTINDHQQIHLLMVDNHDPVERPKHGGRDRHAAFIVRNLDQITLYLDNNNITYTKSRSGRKAIFVRDPDGNTLELMQ